MGDFDASFIHALAVQSWTLYSIGMLLIFMRLYARIHRLGIRGLQTDDYLMIVAGCLYTILVVCLNVISGGGGSNLYLPEEFDTFSPQDIQERIKGSKIVIVSEQAMLNVIYTIKACMLIMYTRLTLGLQAQRLVFYLSIYVFIGWCATEIAFFTACRPFKGYWAMPPPNPQCTTLQHYAIVQACFNISSDTLMLFIPLPLVTRLNVPLKQKAMLFLIFSMGIFVILAAILTKVFNLSNVWDPSYMLWYTREASVAVYVSNLPMIWPLLREWFPFLRSISASSHKGSTAYGPDGGRGTGRGTARKTKGLSLSAALKSGGKRFSSTKRLSQSMVMATMKSRSGESTEELSATEVSSSGRHSWDGTPRPVTASAERGWDANAMAEKMGEHEKGIKITTRVSVSEVHIPNEGETLGRSVHIHVGHDDLEQGLRQKGEFDFSEK